MKSVNRVRAGYFPVKSAALVGEQEGVIRPLLDKIGVNRSQLEQMIDAELKHLPKATGGAPPQPSPDFGCILEAAQTTAQSMQDEFVSTESVEITGAESELARQVLDCVDGPLLYARVDMAPGLDGSPVLMELELVEPSLFFPQNPSALERYVAGIRRHLDEQ